MNYSENDKQYHIQVGDGELILNPEETPLLEFEVPAVMSAAKKKKRR